MVNLPNQTIPYDYTTSGFNGFLRRSIESQTTDTTLRKQASNFRMVNNQQVNFDQTQTTGGLGDVIKVGTVFIDGKTGRISVFEGTNEVVRIGELDG